MSEFFNRKEEVIDFKLTRFGRSLLAEGKLSPVYYAFFDDDVVYDSEYAGLQEDQNDITNRIKEVPRHKPQGAYTGVEENVKSYLEEKRRSLMDSNYIPQPDNEKNYTLPNPLGTSELSSEYIPAWHLRFLTGEIVEGSVEFLTGSTQTLKIPQLHVESTTNIVYDKNWDDEDEGDDDDGDSGKMPADDSFTTYEDGAAGGMTGVDIEHENILIYVKEEHAEFTNENFEIEIYEVEQEETTQGTETVVVEHLKLLPFVKREMNQITGQEEIGDIDSNFAEYYFNILVDDEIEPCDIYNSWKHIPTSEHEFIDPVNTDIVRVCEELTVEEIVEEYEDCEE